MFRKLKTVFKRASRRKAEELHLAVTDEGAALFAGDRQVWSFRWDEVTRIETYKRDLLTVDMICLDFFVASNQVCPTHDEMQGFDVLCERLRRYFPSVAEDWWLQVAFPAFATNYRVLYDKRAA